MDKLTNEDDLDLGDKTFSDMVAEAVKRAFKDGIKANSIIINKDFVKVKKAWINNSFSYCELPDMICGLEVYLTDGELPENYSFAILERDKTEREKLIERVRKETAEKFAERLKARFDKSREYYVIDTGTAWGDGQIGGLINDKIDKIAKEITEGKE